MQAGVLGFVDDTHATAADLLEDAVVRDGLANHGDGEILSCRILGRGVSGVKVLVTVLRKRLVTKWKAPLLEHNHSSRQAGIPVARSVVTLDGQRFLNALAEQREAPIINRAVNWRLQIARPGSGSQARVLFYIDKKVLLHGFMKKTLEPGEEAARPSTHAASYRKENKQLKRLLAEQTLEVDFFTGSLQTVEA